jgi:hypothetical protein
MNQGRFPRRVKISSSHNTTTITTIIMPGADMGQWWSCAHVATTTIIITTITITGAGKLILDIGLAKEAECD